MGSIAKVFGMTDVLQIRVARLPFTRENILDANEFAIHLNRIGSGGVRNAGYPRTPNP